MRRQFAIAKALAFLVLPCFYESEYWTQRIASETCVDLDDQNWSGGARGDRTPDLDNAIVALSQLSYGPCQYQ